VARGDERSADAPDAGAEHALVEEELPQSGSRLRRAATAVGLAVIVGAGGYGIAQAVSRSGPSHAPCTIGSAPPRVYGSGPPDSGSGLLNGMATAPVPLPPPQTPASTCINGVRR
jgi:hypothetical protein